MKCTEQSPRDSFPPGEAVSANAAQTAPAASDGAGGFLPSARGAAQHREAILKAWHAGMSYAEIASVLTQAGAKGSGRTSVRHVIISARGAGDERAAARAKRSESFVAKIAASNRRRSISPETRAKMSAALKGRTMSPEHRAKISVGRRAGYYARATGQ
jgi:hypothetical protein